MKTAHLPLSKLISDDPEMSLADVCSSVRDGARYAYCEEAAHALALVKAAGNLIEQVKKKNPRLEGIDSAVAAVSTADEELGYVQARLLSAPLKSGEDARDDAEMVAWCRRIVRWADDGAAA